MDRPAADAEQLGGILLDPSRLLQSPNYGVALAFLERQGIRAASAVHFQRRLRQPRAVQVARQQYPVPAKHGGPFNGIFQFTHVPGPGIVGEPSNRFGGKFYGGKGVGLTKVLHEVLGQDRNIFPPLTKRGNLQRDHPQPIVQILTELPGFDIGRQIRVRCGNHPAVHGNLTQIADPPDFAVFEEPEKPDLHFGGNVPDFVKEKRSPFRRFDEPLLVFYGMGKGAAYVPEQLALQEAGGR
eukprot:TRINITY_DN19713_c0_g1_i1.p3 TRINITY_DN19713_c0_g1~~TRINITY_DN19713_c0_g1_i1.p3  ORF type:complete len:240 (+),score=-5.28 TRINITY_DN19713_c0_g1_i1:360-1079(+)